MVCAIYNRPARHILLFHRHVCHIYCNINHYFFSYPIGEPNDRRDFVRCAIVSSIFNIDLRAFAQEDDDWSVFQKMSGVFLKLIESTNPIADFITKKKFVGFLRDIRYVLGQIHELKSNIRSLLDNGNCNETDLKLARSYASLLKAELGTLLSQITLLGNCVKPTGIRAEIEEIGSAIEQLEYSKAWIFHPEVFCEINIAERASLSSYIENSINFVKKSESALDDLIDKLA